MAAMRAALEWDQESRDAWWEAYYRWLEQRLFWPGRWAIIPDSPGAPSQINDGLLNDWPFGRSKGAPVWHMDAPVGRLAKLCEHYDRVCLGWIGHPKKEPVGCDAYHRKMEEVSALMGNSWHPLHQLRGLLVAFDYPFDGADATTLAQNGHRYDSEVDRRCGDPWRGRRAYADYLERRGHAHWRKGAHLCGSPRFGRTAARPHMEGQSLVQERLPF
jgi:hypothetical protein